MKFTFKRCGYYTWVMGNRPRDEEGSFFKVDGSYIYDDIKIVGNYGCSFVKGDRIFGTNYANETYLFVPENVYPIIETMFKELSDSNKARAKYWEKYYEERKKEQEEKLNKLRKFVDPKVPIEV
jgi:hypothetical protein